MTKYIRIGFLFCLFYIFYLLLVQLLLGGNELIGIKGELLKKNAFVQPDTLPSGMVSDHAYLSFMIKHDRRFFILSADIEGIDQGAHIFGGVDLELENAGELTIMIKKADFEHVRPKVYAIYADGKNIFELNRKPTPPAYFYLVGILLIVVFTVVWAWPRLATCNLNSKRKDIKNPIAG